MSHVVDKKKKEILKAFVALLREKPYEEIRILEIVEKTKISRSTFYRYFPSKVDLLLHYHDIIFNHIQIVPNSKEEWLDNTPPLILRHFLETVQDQYRYSPFIMKLDNDVDYFIRELNKRLATKFYQSLQENFAEYELNMPQNILAHAMAGLFVETFRWFAEAPNQHSAEATSIHLYSMLQVLLKNALGTSNYKN